MLKFAIAISILTAYHKEPRVPSGKIRIINSPSFKALQKFFKEVYNTLKLVMIIPRSDICIVHFTYLIKTSEDLQMLF